MFIQSLTKYARISPKKMQPLARAIQGRQAKAALDLLSFLSRKDAYLLAKTLKSAMANAENNANVDADGLTINRVAIEKGPAFKRFRPVARGSAHPYKKRTSHIRVVLSDMKSTT